MRCREEGGSGPFHTQAAYLTSAVAANNLAPKNSRDLPPQLRAFFQQAGDTGGHTVKRLAPFTLQLAASAVAYTAGVGISQVRPYFQSLHYLNRMQQVCHRAAMCFVLGKAMSL